MVAGQQNMRAVRRLVRISQHEVAEMDGRLVEQARARRERLAEG